MDTYKKWTDVPENLKTRNQLKELGLRPVRNQPHAAIFDSRYGDWKLYDMALAVPRKPAGPEQLARLEAAREKADKLRTCTGFGKFCGEYLSFEDYGRAKKRHGKPDGWQYVCRFCRDRKRASEWAREVLADERAIILDTETTGLDDDSEIIEIAIINTKGERLFESLVKPVGLMGATHIHGIAAEDVATAPGWYEIDPLVIDILIGASRVISYGAEFDARLITQSRARWGLPPSGSASNRWQCAMEEYARWYGDWSSYHKSYKWQRLQGGHRALGDCLACLEYIKIMAEKEGPHYEPTY